MTHLKRYCLVLLSLSIASCGYVSERNDHVQLALDSLINTKKDSLLFLSFWSGMSKQEFKSVVDLEDRSGNLHNSKFYFFIGDGKDSVGFNLTQPFFFNDKGINLEYRNERWVKGILNHTPSIPTSWDGVTYQQIESSLKKHFDSKYKRFGRSSGSSISWIANEVNSKVIEMSWKYSVRTPFESYDFWQFNDENGEFKWAECYFSITIISLHDYEQQELNNLKSRKLREAKEEEDKRKKENDANEKNNKL